MKRTKFTEQDALVSINIINIAIGLLKNMNKNLRQQSYLIVMLFYSLTWIVLGFKDTKYYPILELLGSLATNGLIAILCVCCMAIIGRCAKHAKKYNAFFKFVCIVCVIIGGFWWLYGTLFPDFHTTTIRTFALSGSIVMTMWSLILLVYF